MAIIIRCERGTADKEGPSISDPLITSTGAAKSRGKRWLDDPTRGAYYLTRKRTLKIPHKSASVVPRAWITVSDSHLGLRNQALKIKSYAFTITPTSIWATINAESYEDTDL